MKPDCNTVRRGGNRNCRGIALLLTLGILLLLTLLALSFSSSQLTESQAARNFYYTAKAEELARGGLEHAIAVLRDDGYYTSGDHHFERWAMFYEEDDGFAPEDDEDDDNELSVDLSDYDELEYDVDEKGDIRSRRKDPWDKDEKESRPEDYNDAHWINLTVRELDPLTGEERERLLGRYAVCIEDENAKANINTAGNPDPKDNDAKWKSHRQNMGFTTAEIDLGMIFDTLGDIFYRYLPNVRDYDYRGDQYYANVDRRTAHDVVVRRYCGDTSTDRRAPGDEDKDDNPTAGTDPLLRQDENGIDDDGDRLIDEDDERIDEPTEFAPYEPTEIRAPGELFVGSGSPTRVIGLAGNDTPYLSVPMIKMARGVSKNTALSLTEPRSPPEDDDHPLDMIYQALLPFITVYSQDLNRFSSREVRMGSTRQPATWMIRENIASWIDRSEGHLRAYDFLQRLRNERIAFTDAGDEDLLRQIAANLADLVDPDWDTRTFGSGDDEVVGIEPTICINEVFPNPPEMPVKIGDEQGVLSDFGEYIILVNPYPFAIDIRDYRITVGSSDTERIRSMAVRRPTTVLKQGEAFLIGDSSGVFTPQTGGRRVIQNDPGLAQTLSTQLYGGLCDAYTPLSLPSNGKMELRATEGRLSYMAEVSWYPDPGFASALKDDPRVRRREYWQLGTHIRARGGPMAKWKVLDWTRFWMPGFDALQDDPDYSPTKEQYIVRQRRFGKRGALSSIGHLAKVHRGGPWETLNLAGVGDHRDDVRLWDMLTLPYPYKHDELRRQTELDKDEDLPPAKVVPGRINVNTASPEVLMGLNWEPMFRELGLDPRRHAGQMIRWIIETRPYPSLGELARAIPGLGGVKPNELAETFLKYNVNLITTRSNIFKVTVLAEVYDRKEKLAASRKLEAVVDRGYTPGNLGRDGERSPSREERARAETARILYFRWITED